MDGSKNLNIVHTRIETARTPAAGDIIAMKPRTSYRQDLTNDFSESAAEMLPTAPCVCVRPILRQRPARCNHVTHIASDVPTSSPNKPRNFLFSIV